MGSHKLLLQVGSRADDVEVGINCLTPGTIMQAIWFLKAPWWLPCHPSIFETMVCHTYWSTSNLSSFEMPCSLVYAKMKSCVSVNGGEIHWKDSTHFVHGTYKIVVIKSTINIYQQDGWNFMEDKNMVRNMHGDTQHCFNLRPLTLELKGPWPMIYKLRGLSRSQRQCQLTLYLTSKA